MMLQDKEFPLSLTLLDAGIGGLLLGLHSSADEFQYFVDEQNRTGPQQHGFPIFLRERYLLWQRAEHYEVIIM